LWRGDRAVRVHRREARLSAYQAALPDDSWLFGKPTVINNVETLCNVPLIIERVQRNIANSARRNRPVQIVLCFGRCDEARLYEVPFGVTLRELLKMAGGPSTSLRTTGKKNCNLSCSAARRERLPHPNISM
jgi:NADH:ubiquinone oxidoreductase subunit F (NADH-binding)